MHTLETTTHVVTPANAGVQQNINWIPAYAGMTKTGLFRASFSAALPVPKP